MSAAVMRNTEINPVIPEKNEKNEGVYFSAYEWKVFTEELKLGKDVKTALHNARYLEKLSKGIKQLEEGHGQIHELIEVEDD